MTPHMCERIWCSVLTEAPVHSDFPMIGLGTSAATGCHWSLVWLQFTQHNEKSETKLT